MWFDGTILVSKSPLIWYKLLNSHNFSITCSWLKLNFLIFIIELWLRYIVLIQLNVSRLSWCNWILPFRKSPTFNKEVYVDFVAAQIKTLSFLAYIIRIYQDMVNTYSQNMVGGMLGLLRYCPQEVAHLRKELLIAARHILATDLRNSE